MPTTGLVIASAAKGCRPSPVNVASLRRGVKPSFQFFRFYHALPIDGDCYCSRHGATTQRNQSSSPDIAAVRRNPGGAWRWTPIPLRCIRATGCVSRQAAVQGRFILASAGMTVVLVQQDLGITAERYASVRCGARLDP